MLNFGKRWRKGSSQKQRQRQTPARAQAPTTAERSAANSADDRGSKRPSYGAQRPVRPNSVVEMPANAARTTERQRLTVVEAETLTREPSPRQRQRSSEPNSKRPQPKQRRSRPYLGTTDAATVAPSKPARPGRSSRPPLSPSGLALLYGTRLLILGVGIGVIAGTLLSVWDPANRVTADVSKSPQPEAVASPEPGIPTLELVQEIAPLKAELQRIIAQPTDLATGLMVVDLDNGSYLDINAAASFSAASTIKFPILVAFFQDVDAGKIRLDEMLTMRKDLVATEAGDLQFQPVGSQFTALEVATKMMTISDNTATNMIIDRLGGKEAVNQRFQSWGLMNTSLQELLPDLKGTNTSSPKDMATLLGVINKGQVLSMRSLGRMLEMMRNVQNTSMLPQGLGEGGTIAHKTGDIGGMVGDVGIIDLPSGKRYLITAMVKRPRNDDRAITLIQQISKKTYQYFDKGSVTAPGNASPVPTASPEADGAQPNSPGGAAPASPAPAPGNSQGAAPLSRIKIAQP